MKSASNVVSLPRDHSRPGRNELEFLPGALEIVEALSHALLTMTGMDAIAMSPKAGAHGELCGMMSIRAALEARGEQRHRVVVGMD